MWVVAGAGVEHVAIAYVPLWVLLLQVLGCCCCVVVAAVVAVVAGVVAGVIAGVLFMASLLSGADLCRCYCACIIVAGCYVFYCGGR